MLYRRLIRPLLFAMDPERAHHVALTGLRFAGLPPLRSALGLAFGTAAPELEQTIWGLRFANPVGLAAGFDKNARVVPALARMGFGFLEVGAISSVPRPGNPRPRIFRLRDDRALINRMGLPNDGAVAIAARLARLGAQPVPVFANIVKTADLDGDVATMAADYVTTLNEVLPHVDGFTVNVSCPATPNLKAFHRQDAMVQLLTRLREARDRGNAALGDGRTRPLILKVSPDVDRDEEEVVTRACRDGLLDGLVLTNTTTRRPATLRAPASTVAERGGLSGAPLFPVVLGFVERFAGQVEVPIIAVGGIGSADDAGRMLEAGASLVEVYTGYVYEGPRFPAEIVRGLSVRGWRPRHARGEVVA